jgi:hypothetical protein
MSGILTDDTDREALEELLRRFGLTPYTGGRPEVDPPTGGEVILLAHEGGVDGYNGFRAAFTFDDSGKFQHLGIWE